MNTNRSWVSLANGLWRACLKSGLIKLLLGGDDADGCKCLHALMCVLIVVEGIGWVAAESLPGETWRSMKLALSQRKPPWHQLNFSENFSVLSSSWPFSTEAILEKLLVNADSISCTPCLHCFSHIQTDTHAKTDSTSLKSNFKTC